MECKDTKFLCPDNVCRDNDTVTVCGDTCGPCVAKVNATATECNGSVSDCTYECDAGFIECADTKCGRIHWDFDTGNTQGWNTTSDSPLEAVTPSTTKKVSGTHSLAGRAISDEFYQVFVESKICNGLGTNLVGRRFKAQILMDMTPHPGSNPASFPSPTFA